MPLATKTPSNSAVFTPGEELEARVAQLWFWEGFVARRSINLQRYYFPDPLVVTDLDLLAFEFGPTLQRRKFIGEAKTGTGRSAPAPLDRVVWLRGLLDLTGADGAELTTAVKPSGRVRELAAGLGIVAQSTEDLIRREQQARMIDVADLGGQGVLAMGDLVRVHHQCRQDEELERAFWFLRSEAWLADPWLSTKRTITLIRRMAKRLVPGVMEEEVFALRWLLCEAVCVAAVQIVTIAGHAIHRDSTQFSSYVADRLAEGLASKPVMHRVADAVDKFLGAFLRQAGAPPTIQFDAMGAFLPKPPEYTAPLVELSQRLAISAIHTRHVPRYLELVLFERVVHEREVSQAAIARLGLSDRGLVERAARLIVSFLQGQANLAVSVVEAVTVPHNHLDTVERDIHVERTADGSSTPQGEKPAI